MINIYIDNTPFAERDALLNKGPSTKNFRIFYRHWADKLQIPSPLAVIGQNFHDEILPFTSFPKSTSQVHDGI